MLAVGRSLFWWARARLRQAAAVGGAPLIWEAQPRGPDAGRGDCARGDPVGHGFAGSRRRPLPKDRCGSWRFGDSLTAGYGLPADAAFPVRLQKALAAKGVAVEIGNAGVSGDTTSGGLARLDWSVPEGTQAVILELGANDMLRGLDPRITRKALQDILSRLKERHIEVLLCGMLAAPNLGADYAPRVRRDLSGSGRERAAVALSVLPGGRRQRPAAGAARRPASDRRRRRRHRGRHSPLGRRSWWRGCAARSGG